jgi:hypothetical protein
VHLEFILCLLTAIITFGAIAIPLFFAKPGTLQPASRIEDPIVLSEMMTGLVESYVKEELDFEKGLLSKSQWQARSRFLLNRYIDASHQMARLEGTRSAKTPAQSAVGTNP